MTDILPEPHPWLVPECKDCPASGTKCAHAKCKFKVYKLCANCKDAIPRRIKQHQYKRNFQDPKKQYCRACVEEKWSLCSRRMEPSTDLPPRSSTGVSPANITEQQEATVPATADQQEGEPTEGEATANAGQQEAQQEAMMYDS